MNVKNRTCIRRLARNTMKAARTRNIIAILAIALTTILFTSLFTVGMSVNHSFQQANFRQVGGFNHGTFKYLTKEQFEELKDDSVIAQYGLRRFVGMPKKDPFRKAHVEVGYSDPNQAHWMFCDPVEGHLPAEDTREAATDTRVLSLLGVEPVLGNEFTMTFDVSGKEVTETFVLSGWWEYDEAVMASHVLVPHSRAQEIYDKTGIGIGIGSDRMTGSWTLDVMMGRALHIGRDMDTVLANYGYQTENPADRSTYIATGVNWGYTGAQFSDSADPMMILAIVGLLLIIVFTGYLIIYNVFQISVSNDIRFYGLLKTIGTTGRQLKRVVRYQAVLLSLVGIPAGLVTGYGVGIKLTPVILSRMNGVVVDALSASPLIFLGAALFSLATVVISCRRPGKMAASVSPVEAVRYTEGSMGQKKRREKKRGGKKRLSLAAMAWANLGRNRSKTVITMASLSLAVLLLNLIVAFTNGFDLNKYLKNMVSDFVVADAGHFQLSGFWSKDQAVPESVIDMVNAQPGVEAGGRVYGKSSPIEELITEEQYRYVKEKRYDEEMLQRSIKNIRQEDGLLSTDIQLYGMEEYALDKLRVVEGELDKLKEAGDRYVAAVYKEDDYNKVIQDTHWARVGDKVTLRYVEEYEYYDLNTGEILSKDQLTEDRAYWHRAREYQDVEYEVAAVVTIPHTLSYRYYGADEFIMNDQTFLYDTGTSDILYYACDVDDGQESQMEAFLQDFTTSQMPQFDFESKETYREEFDSFRNMFLILGGVLSLIIGLVGVLNFINTILTGILARRREFAVLQSIGMTGTQLKTMLIWEGLYYALCSIVVSLLLSVAAGPMMSGVVESLFWFFTYRFTVTPILLAAPVFAALGIALPLLVHRVVSRRSIVERLREAE